MADINAYLREAINGPAPQHKVAGRNQFEFSEGSDGAPHTKIVDVDGNPLSTFPVDVEFPTDYPDGAVKAELELIKAQQAQILGRMDETFDTQLIGSNVDDGLPVKDDLAITELEEIRMSQSVIANKISEPPVEEVEMFKDVVIEPGQFIGSTQILKGFDYFILAHSAAGKHSAESPVDVTVTARYRASNNIWLSAPEKIAALEGHYSVSERMEVSTPQVYIAFKNETDKPMELNNIFIFKVK